MMRSNQALTLLTMAMLSTVAIMAGGTETPGATSITWSEAGVRIKDYYPGQQQPVTTTATNWQGEAVGVGMWDPAKKGFSTSEVVLFDRVRTLLEGNKMCVVIDRPISHPAPMIEQLSRPEADGIFASSYTDCVLCQSYYNMTADSLNPDCSVECPECLCTYCVPTRCRSWEPAPWECDPYNDPDCDEEGTGDFGHIVFDRRQEEPF